MMPVNIFSLSTNAQSILSSAATALNRGSSKTPVKMKLVDMNESSNIKGMKIEEQIKSQIEQKAISKDLAIK